MNEKQRPGFEMKVYACMTWCCEAAVNIWTTSKKDKLYKCVLVLGIRIFLKADWVRERYKEFVHFYTSSHPLTVLSPFSWYVLIM